MIDIPLNKALVAVKRGTQNCDDCYLVDPYEGRKSIYHKEIARKKRVKKDRK